MKTKKPEVMKRWAASRDSGDQMAAQANYRWRVEALKWLLPAAALGLTMAIVWSWLNRPNPGFRLDYALEGFELSGQAEMLNPRFLGVDKHNQRYTVTAEAAMRPVDETEQVFLINPTADIAMSGGGWLILNAEQGTYDRHSETITLRGTVSIYADSGFEMHTEIALFDMGNSVVTGDSKVNGQGPWGLLEADGFRYSRADDVLHFSGRPKLTLYPDIPDSTQ